VTGTTCAIFLASRPSPQLLTFVLICIICFFRLTCHLFG